MIDRSRKDVGALIRDGKVLDEAMARAYQRVIERHRQEGIPLVIWRDGQVVEVPAEEFDLTKGVG